MKRRLFIPVAALLFALVLIPAANVYANQNQITAAVNEQPVMFSNRNHDIADDITLDFVGGIFMALDFHVIEIHVGPGGGQPALRFANITRGADTVEIDLIDFGRSIFTGNDEIAATVNGQSVMFAEQDRLIGDWRILVFTTEVFHALGFEVEWSHSRRQAVLTRGADTVEITLVDVPTPTPTPQGGCPLWANDPRFANPTPTPVPVSRATHVVIDGARIPIRTMNVTLYHLGNRLTLRLPTFTFSGGQMYPIEETVVAFGGEFSFNQLTQVMTIVLGNTQIVINLAAETMTVNGASQAFPDVAIIDDMFFVPVTILENLNLSFTHAANRAEPPAPAASVAATRTATTTGTWNGDIDEFVQSFFNLRVRSHVVFSGANGEPPTSFWALLEDGTLWEMNREPLLNSLFVTDSHTPVQILDNVIILTRANPVMRADGSIWAWGTNRSQGPGMTINSPVPIMIASSLVWVNEEENIIATNNGPLGWHPRPDMLGTDMSAPPTVPHLTIPQYEQEITTRTRTQISLQNNHARVSLSDIMTALNEANRLRGEFTTAYLAAAGTQAREIEIHVHIDFPNATGRTQIDLNPDLAGALADRIIFIIDNLWFGFSPAHLQADFTRHSIISIIITQMADGSFTFIFADENGNEITLSQNAFLTIAYGGLVTESVLFRMVGNQRNLLGGRVEGNRLHFQTRGGGSFLIGQNVAVFTDIGNESAAIRHAIESLAARDIISAANNRFNPRGILSRAEATAWLVNALYMTDRDHHVPFSDVNPNTQHFAAISTGVAEGIISGYQDNTFRPTQQITKQELLTITSNILVNERSYILPANPLGYLGLQTTAVSTWARPFAAMAVRDAVTAQDQLTRSRQGITRGEAALIIYNLFNRL